MLSLEIFPLLANILHRYIEDPHYEVQGIERVYPTIPGGDFKRRWLNRATLWMFPLQTVYPKGLNLRPDLILHYCFCLCSMSYMCIQHAHVTVDTDGLINEPMYISRDYA